MDALGSEGVVGVQYLDRINAMIASEGSIDADRFGQFCGSNY